MCLSSNLGASAGGFRRSALVVGTAVLVAALFTACGGGDSGTPPASPGLVAGFTPSSTAAASNLVRLEKVSATGDKVTLAVVIDGPTSQDIYSYAFDLVIANVAVGKYVDKSIVPGDMLVPDTVNGQSVTAVASQQGNHVVIGVSKLGGGAGNDVASGEKTIATLTFQLLQTGVCGISFVASAGHADPAALDSLVTEIPFVVFDSQASQVQAN